MHKAFLISALASLAAISIPGVNAGKGATINACVWFYTLSQPVSFHFIAGSESDHCMNDKGHDADLEVRNPGLSCVSLGYVEDKASSTKGDTCLTDKKYWGTAYNSNTTYSGSTNTRWNSKGVYLEKQSTGTNICSNRARCDATSQTFHGTGELWIIYQPGSTSKTRTIVVKEDLNELEADRMRFDDTNLYLTHNQLNLALHSDEL